MAARKKAAALDALAEKALALMRRQGFDGAQVEASRRRHVELNIAYNEPSLLRSGHAHKLCLTGLLDGRRAAVEAAELSAMALADSVAALWAAVQSAPQDAANAVSAGQQLRIVQGPLQPDGGEGGQGEKPGGNGGNGGHGGNGDGSQASDTAAAAMAELRQWRSEYAPTVMIEEAFAAHHQLHSHTLTSGGSSLDCAIGWYQLSLLATAREHGRTSSFNHCGGNCHQLSGQPLVERFGIAAMLHDLGRQVVTEPIGTRFVGELVLAPTAVAGLIEWLLGQLSDQSLIAGSSLYRERVGEAVASPLLTLASRFDAPGVAAVSADAFAAPPVTLLQAGKLLTLTPSLYGSRKTGIPHRPVAGGGWALEAGSTPLDRLVAGTKRGAVVGRLSMGRPAANGDFSAVLKNSFLIEGGERGPALREAMASGNVAAMLRDVQAVSAERIDTGLWLLPWLRIGGLHFS